MEKSVVNNFLVQMRGYTIQARVHIVHKLVREIKKLRNREGTEEQKDKNEKKAKRYEQELLFIKELKPHEISKFALLCLGDPHQLIKKDSLSLKERAKLKLAAHKSIAQQVELFRLKYPDWSLKLPPIIAQIGLRHKYKKKISPHLQSPLKTEPTKINKIGSIDIEEDTKTRQEVTSKIKREMRIQKQNCTESYPENSVNNLNETDTHNNKNSTDQKEEICADVDFLELSQKSSSEDKVSGTVKKNNGIAVVQRFADLLEMNKDLENSQDVSVSKEENNPSRIKEDPFFLTGDGSEEEEMCNEKKNDKYFNTDILKNANSRWKDSENSLGKQKQREINKCPILNRKQRRMLERAKLEGKSTSKLHLLSNSFSKHFDSSAHKKIPYHSNRGPVTTLTAEKQENLHPSWEAKRKQREIVPFQGKIIKFDVSDDE